MKLKLQYFGQLMRRTDSLEKILILDKDKILILIEDKMVGWHHLFSVHGLGCTPGVGDGQGALACCGSWDRKELDMTE